jgi:hypothetical protein
MTFLTDRKCYIVLVDKHVRDMIWYSWSYTYMLTSRFWKLNNLFHCFGRYGKKTVRKAFADVISSAKKRSELVCGVYEAAQVLRR